MEKQALKSIGISLLIVLAIVLTTSGCTDSSPSHQEQEFSEQQPEMKYVVEIISENVTYPVTITKQTKGNSIKNGATGALLGGGASLLFGGSAKDGAIIGGIIATAATGDPETETYTTTKTDTHYTIRFDDGSVTHLVNYCHYEIGDGVRAGNN